jgi:hypothetical protein
MGYRKALALDRISITLRFLVKNEDDGTQESAEVSHVFKQPTPGEKNEYERILARVKGKKMSFHKSQANWFLWDRCVVDVRDYDDLEEDYQRDSNGILTGEWKNYFKTGITRIHVDEFTQVLLEKIEGEEVDLEKKFED